MTPLWLKFVKKPELLNRLRPCYYDQKLRRKRTPAKCQASPRLEERKKSSRGSQRALLCAITATKRVMLKPTAGRNTPISALAGPGAAARKRRKRKRAKQTA